MSGFTPDWLALRERVDHVAINHAVRTACVRAFAGRESIRVVDLGCGTGSNLRSLAPDLPPNQHWTLVDNDPRLLGIARQRCRETKFGRAIETEFQLADLAKADWTSLLSGADLVTASALFDLVSAEFIEQFAAAVARQGAALYTVLSYDGIAAFLPEHSADAAMRKAFNHHQRRDKGLGPALGPYAPDALAATFERYGYVIRRGRSPWVLDNAQTALKNELVRGWAKAVRETGHVPEAVVDNWLSDRLSPATVAIIGHEDLLALPPGK
ncbi:MAG: hypothetical protein DIU63_13060 [Proteobacteria bacterium]|jgi:Trans-aconitate methyltransferase|nr:MAG: hypothetical protein DIU63_13060 [Pseudomonadota bacterium]